MQVTPVTFNGLWSKPKPAEKIGIFNSINNNPIYRTRMIYHPFKDETIEQIQKEIKDCHHSFYKQYNPPTSIYSSSYHFVEASVGERLNITADDYEKVKKLTPKAFANSSDVTYERLSDKYSREIIKDLKNPTIQEVGPYSC